VGSERESGTNEASKEKRDFSGGGNRQSDVDCDWWLGAGRALDRRGTSESERWWMDEASKRAWVVALSVSGFERSEGMLQVAWWLVLLISRGRSAYRRRVVAGADLAR
jgi:hypothetical protein